MTATLSPLFTWRSAIVESELSRHARHVALTLTLHMNERGASCFPTLDELQHETSKGRATIIEALRELEAGGWLFVERKERPGRGHKNHYTATFPEGFSPGPFLTKRVLGLQRKGFETALKGSEGAPKDVKDVKEDVDDELVQNGYRHVCTVCGLRFKGPRTLQAHLRNVHDEQEVPA